MSTEANLRAVKLVQGLLETSDRSTISPSAIQAVLAQVQPLLAMQGSADLDADWIVEELVRRFSVWIGNDRTLANNVGHVDWLDAPRQRGWRYWQRYREFLEVRLPWAAVAQLHTSTGNVLAHLEDPTREGPWDRRGLVVGHVQSGKTGHYNGLICKAADAGYKIIIVLAGLHNNLRSQTQARLDEGFLGFETSPDKSSLRAVGVGEIDSDHSIRPNFATNRSEGGDFNTKAARHLGITPEQRPWLFVIKKNKTVLEQLLRWIRDHVADTTENGERRVSQLPLLVIDDEADNASVDTGEQTWDESGKPDEEHRPTAINRAIRRLLRAFTRSAYVGYTATPFANIFIHENGETATEGPDLFPAAFIVNLAAPSNYVGPRRVFGGLDEEGQKVELPLVIDLDHAYASDHLPWMPNKHKSDHVPRTDAGHRMPESLREAIDAFVLVCAARRLRNQASEHCSMLIHVTRFNVVQRTVVSQVDEYVRQLMQRIHRKIDAEALYTRMEEVWRREFVAKGPLIRANAPDIAGPDHSWEEVREALPDAIAEIQVRTINGQAKEALDYVEHRATGLKVIAVGGDKLSRGLTLEGLTVSYFLRASKMYDTLMQMGRWFGYRPGYLDLCRLYTTAELIGWFRHITEAADELRAEFDTMAAQGATPREYGLKVQAHPSLMITSRLKMRAAKDLYLSFSGSVLETVALRRDLAAVSKNLTVTKRLIGKLGPSAPEFSSPRPDGREDTWVGARWEEVPAEHIVDFLRSYQTHPDARKVNGPLIADFIESMRLEGELGNWTVAVIGASDGSEKRERADIGVVVPFIQRHPDLDPSDPSRFSIGRLLSPRDEALDLDADAWSDALERTRQNWETAGSNPSKRRADSAPDRPSGPAIRYVRGMGGPRSQAHRERGLLLIYALDPGYRDRKKLEEEPSPVPLWDHEQGEDRLPIVAFGISFPASTSGTRVRYKVNNVLWEQEYGASE
jgi:hypothetical protein